MKKLLQILFIFIYLLPTVGLTVAYHFCGDTLVSASIASANAGKEPSDCCGEDQDDDTCCHTQFKSYKLDDMHFASAKIELNKLAFDVYSYQESVNDFAVTSNEINHSSLLSHSPPRENSYLNNRVLRI